MKEEKKKRSGGEDLYKEEKKNEKDEDGDSGEDEEGDDADGHDDHDGHGHDDGAADGGGVARRWRWWEWRWAWSRCGGGRGREGGCSGDAAGGGGSIDTPVGSPRMSCGNPVHRKHSRHFVVAATPRICFSMAARRSFGSKSACSSVFQAVAVRSAVSTAICQSGLAGILAV